MRTINFSVRPPNIQRPGGIIESGSTTALVFFYTNNASLLPVSRITSGSGWNTADGANAPAATIFVFSCLFFFFWFVVGPHPVPMPSDGPDFHWHANLHQGRVQRMITPSSGEGIYSGHGAGRRGCGVALEPRGWRTRADRAGPDDAPRAGQDTTHVRVHTGVRCRYPCTGGGPHRVV